MLTLSLAFGAVAAISTSSKAQMISTDALDGRTFAPIFAVNEKNFRKFLIQKSKSAEALESNCQTLRKYFKKYSWNLNPCNQIDWKTKLSSREGNPLIYAQFGTGKNTTLFLGGVHPDELTPIHLAFKFADHLSKNPSIYEEKDIRIIIAPLVNPDGFFLEKAKRVNQNGVDVNRNFLTLDWYEKAIKAWRNRRSGKLRYFPGYFPNTELETIFQVGLIEEFQPAKIISVHAPLGFLDYDGPGDQNPRSISKTERQAKRLVHKISKKMKNYRIVDYSFYPGSLGNYGGNERDLPTVTLELENSDPGKVDQYWEQFMPGLILSAQFPFAVTTKKPKPAFAKF